MNDITPCLFKIRKGIWLFVLILILILLTLVFPSVLEHGLLKPPETSGQSTSEEGRGAE